MGYSEESKAYKLYNPQTGKLVVSRDVIFDEAIMWKWDNTETQTHAGNTKATSKAITPASTTLSPFESPSPNGKHILEVVTSASPTPSPHILSSPSSSEPPPLKTRRLREIYDTTNEVRDDDDDETNLFCLYADHKPLSFQEASEQEC